MINGTRNDGRMFFLPSRLISWTRARVRAPGTSLIDRIVSRRAIYGVKPHTYQAHEGGERLLREIITGVGGRVARSPKSSAPRSYHPAIIIPEIVRRGYSRPPTLTVLSSFFLINTRIWSQACDVHAGTPSEKYDRNFSSNDRGRARAQAFPSRAFARRGQ